MTKEYNISKLDKELRAAGLEIFGVNDKGEISWVKYPRPLVADRELVDGEWFDLPITPVPQELLTIAEAVKANHNPVETISQPVDIYADLLKALTPETDGDYDFEVATAVATWVTSSPAAMLWVTPALNRKSGVLDKDLLKRAAAFIEQEIASEKLPANAGAKLLEILGGLIGV